MPQFKPCLGKSACRENETMCLSCGRSLEEITWLRDLIGQLSSLAQEYAYDNIDEYCNYVAAKMKKTIQHRRSL